MTPTTFREVAARFNDNGYPVVPIAPGLKHPALPGWQNFCYTPGCEGQYPRYGAGVLAATCPGVDIDVSDQEVVARIESMVREVIGIGDAAAIPRRTGRWPRVLLPFRTEQPFTKKKTGEYRLKHTPEEKPAHVEILASGQQWVANHLHPDTHKAYEWNGHDLLNTARADLFLLTAAMADKIIAAADEILAEYGELVKEHQEPSPTGANVEDGAIPETSRNNTLASLAGSMRHRGMTRPEIEAALLAVNRERCTPSLPEHEVRGIAASVSRYAPAPTPEWPRVQDIFRDVVIPPYAPQDFPEPVARIADAYSASTGFDGGAALLACTAAAAAVIDDRYRLAVRPGSAWFESARLWVVLIGGPSTGKSPTIRVACDPIRSMHTETWQEWEGANRDSKPEERDPEPCYFTSDATLEALSDVLRANPRGVLMLTEEFASWIGSIDCYRNGQGSRDRGEMLQLFDGGPHQIHRVKRGSFLIPNWGASVLAAGTPAGLRENVRQLPDDGLIHRFLPCIMRRPGTANGTTVREALELWDQTLRRLRAETTTAETAQRAAFSRPAWELFNAETARIREVTADAETISPALASHLGKHPGLLARVALTFSVLREERGEISVETVAMAVRMLRTARKHAAALYLDILQTAPVCELARAVGRSIAAATDAPAQVSRAWLSSHCRAFRDAGDRNRRAAVEWLEDAGWLRPTQDSRPYGGWSATSWDVSPDVAARFGAVGDEHRKRRASVRTLIVGE